MQIRVMSVTTEQLEARRGGGMLRPAELHLRGHWVSEHIREKPFAICKHCDGQSITK